MQNDPIELGTSNPFQVRNHDIFDTQIINIKTPN